MDQICQRDRGVGGGGGEEGIFMYTRKQPVER